MTVKILLLFVLYFCLLMEPVIASSPPAPVTAPLELRFQELVRDYNADPDRYKYTLPSVFGKAPLKRDYAKETLALAMANPSSAVAADALIWLFLIAPNDAQYVEACNILESYHFKSDKLDQICLVPYFANAVKEHLIFRLSKSSPCRNVRGNACYAIATANITTKPRLSIKLFKRIIKHYGSVQQISADKNAHVALATVAEKRMYDLLHFSAGCEAPPLAGTDVNGKTMNLTDFRSKIVMLVFFGHWCRPCRKLYPLEHMLLQQFQGRPFVILGVNSDSAETLQKLIADKTIEYPCWLDTGITDGRIAQQWHVSGWPSVFIIDHKGVIRFTVPGGDEKNLSQCISTLLAKLKK